MNTHTQPLILLSMRKRHPQLAQLSLAVAGLAVAAVAAWTTAWPAWLVPCALLPGLGLLAEIDT